MSIFESIMLICFGAAWPVSIYKSIKTKTNGSKSLFFLFIVFFGYLSGIMHKIIFSRDIVIIFYILNFIMVGIDIVLFFRNASLEKDVSRKVCKGAEK